MLQKHQCRSLDLSYGWYFRACWSSMSSSMPVILRNWVGSIRVFICFCPSQCDSQELCPSWNINYQSHLSHKCHDTNHVYVCCNTFKTLDSSEVWCFKIYHLLWLTFIVSHNVRDKSKWIIMSEFEMIHCSYIVDMLKNFVITCFRIDLLASFSQPASFLYRIYIPK